MIVIKPIKIREEYKPLICLSLQILAFCAFVIWCYGIALVSKDWGLQDYFGRLEYPNKIPTPDVNNFFDDILSPIEKNDIDEYLELSGSALIGSMTGLITTCYFAYKLAYKYSKQDWEQNQLKAMGSGLFDKETHLGHREMLIRFEQSQLSMEEKAKMKEMEIQKKLKNMEILKKKAIKNEK